LCTAQCLQVGLSGSRVRRPGSDETIFRIDEKLRKQLDPYAGVNKDKGGVMDFVAAFLALISIGVFAAHTLDALRAD
jgi:hypothetical protein